MGNMVMIPGSHNARIPLPEGTDALSVHLFFQAEDGIRDVTVTGVQTCALPISGRSYAGRAIRLSPRHALADRRRGVRRLCPGFCDSFLFHPPRREIARPDGARRRDRKSVV